MEYNAFRSLLDGLAEQWNDAFRSLGIQTHAATISTVSACRLLAALYLYGGENECFTLNERIVDDILEAQNLLNLHGGETPDGRKIPYLQDCIKDFQAHPDRAVTFMRSNYNETIHVE